MILEITYIDDKNKSTTIQVDLESDELEIIENYFYNQIGYYPNSLTIRKI